MIYFNFLHTPSGGGYQNSISFIKSLLYLNYDFSDTCVITYENSGIHQTCLENDIKFISVRNGLFWKTLRELTMSLSFHKKDIVFAIFGPPFFFSKGRTINISGIAISNVFHNEINFWGYLPRWKKTFKILKDHYRFWRYKKSDFWIFETNFLMEKAVSVYGFPKDRCFHVNMSPSLLINEENALNRIKNRSYIKKNDAEKIFLFLASGHPNKRLHLLPKLAKKLKATGIKFRFILTATENDYIKEVLKEAQKYGVQNNIENIGSIPAEDVASVIYVCDFICTFSLLESFSNNFVEAWAMKKLLFVTDADWSRAACGSAAVYLNLSDIEKSAKDIKKTIESPTITSKSIKNGTIMLERHPSAVEKSLQYLSIIDKCSKY